MSRRTSRNFLNLQHARCNQRQNGKFEVAFFMTAGFNFCLVLWCVVLCKSFVRNMRQLTSANGFHSFTFTRWKTPTVLELHLTYSISHAWKKAESQGRDANLTWKWKHTHLFAMDEDNNNFFRPSFYYLPPWSSASSPLRPSSLWSGSSSPIRSASPLRSSPIPFRTPPSPGSPVCDGIDACSTRQYDRHIALVRGIILRIQFGLS